MWRHTSYMQFCTHLKLIRWIFIGAKVADICCEKGSLYPAYVLLSLMFSEVVKRKFVSMLACQNYYADKSVALFDSTPQEQWIRYCSERRAIYEKTIIQHWCKESSILILLFIYLDICVFSCGSFNDIYSSLENITNKRMNAWWIFKWKLCDRNKW